MFDRHTLGDFDPETVALARARVRQGAHFFNRRFPGWQRRLQNAGSLLSMDMHDYCAAALAARGRKGPNGVRMYTHGAVLRAYPDFAPVRMGTQDDEFVSYELLGLLWREAAATVPPLPRETGWERLKRRLCFKKPALA